MVTGVPHEYWGRDDDINEVIMFPQRLYECSRTVIVIVTQVVGNILNWNEDFVF